MLEIVLLILKIAGIIFGSVLGILIAAACFLLFVPVRYRGDFSVADEEEGKKKAVGVSFRATWLLRLVRIIVSYEGTARVRMKVLFFTLMDTAGEEKKKRRKKEKEKEPPKEKTENASEEKESSGEKDPEIEQRIKPGEEKSVGETDREKLSDREKALEAETGEEEILTGEAEKAEREKKGIVGGISNILQTIGNFCDKLKGIKEKAEKIEELWISDHMVSSRSLLGKQFAYLLKHTKPKRLAGYIRFGFDDPAATGYAMALYGILYPIWSPKLSVEPDFENHVLECHILLKGKIRVWHFVRAALRLYFSKDVRRAIKDVKKL